MDSPGAADVVLIGNVRNELLIGRHSPDDRGQMFRALMDSYPDRCFSLSDDDLPLILNRGIVP